MPSPIIVESPVPFASANVTLSMAPYDFISAMAFESVSATACAFSGVAAYDFAMRAVMSFMFCHIVSPRSPNANTMSELAGMSDMSERSILRCSPKTFASVVSFIVVIFTAMASASALGSSGQVRLVQSLEDIASGLAVDVRHHLAHAAGVDARRRLDLGESLGELVRQVGVRLEKRRHGKVHRDHAILEERLEPVDALA